MENQQSRRKQKGFSLKRSIIYAFFVIVFLSIGVTLVRVVPQVIQFAVYGWYISPLAATPALPTSGDQVTTKTVTSSLKKAGLTVKKIDTSEDAYIVLLDSDEKILFSKKKPINTQIASLQLIRSRFTIEGKHFVSLDLRFDRPVLVSK